MRKQQIRTIMLLTLALCALTSAANAVSLTAIYDFTDLNPLTTSFEGLDFTNDGTLWITSSPNGYDANGKLLPGSLLGVDLDTETVNFQQNFSRTTLINPVALASDGETLFIGNNGKAGYGIDLADPIYKGVIDPETGNVSLTKVFTLPGTNFWTGVQGVCAEPEGSAFLNGSLYFSCQDGKDIIKVNPLTGKVEDRYAMGVQLLGLGATADSLILGDYTNHQLQIFNVATNTITQTIDLADLFVGAQSDYTKLTGELYEVTIADNNDIRYIPDPDGIAYRNGKIYMTFEHDLRVYEIALGTPEPGTLLLIGSGLIGLAALRRKR